MSTTDSGANAGAAAKLVGELESASDDDDDPGNQHKHDGGVLVPHPTPWQRPRLMLGANAAANAALRHVRFAQDVTFHPSRDGSRDSSTKHSLTTRRPVHETIPSQRGSGDKPSHPHLLGTIATGVVQANKWRSQAKNKRRRRAPSVQREKQLLATAHAKQPSLFLPPLSPPQPPAQDAAKGRTPAPLDPPLSLPGSTDDGSADGCLTDLMDHNQEAVQEGGGASERHGSHYVSEQLAPVPDATSTGLGRALQAVHDAAHQAKLRGDGAPELPSLAPEGPQRGRVHYVLVHVQGTEETETADAAYEDNPHALDDPPHVTHAKFRAALFRNLRQQGLVLQHRAAPPRAGRQLVYTLVTAPFTCLCTAAEVLRLRKPVTLASLPAYQQQQLLTSRRMSRQARSAWYHSWGCLGCIKHTPIAPAEEQVLDVFTDEALFNFAGAENPNRLFSSREAAMLTAFLIDHTVFQDGFHGEGDALRGIERLVHKGALLTAFPLHDGLACGKQPDNDRALLRRYWASWSQAFKVQPLDLIRGYFGESVAMYFGWLGMYTSWLAAPMIVGIIIFVVGIFFGAKSDVDQVCSSNVTLCALCSTCEQLPLRDQCTTYRVSTWFDNDYTVLFAVVMSIWSTLFLEFWRRQQTYLAWHWGTLRFTKDQPIRPMFDPDRTEMDPISGQMVPGFSPSKRRNRLAIGFATCATFVSLVVAVAIGIVVYRAAVREALVLQGYEESSAAITSATASVINLVLILFLNFVYGKLAHKLTQWENHKFEEDFQRHLTLKNFVFQCTNYYTSFFYVAFFKANHGQPGNWDMFLGNIRRDSCPTYGCMFELSIHVAVTMIGKQLWGNLQEFVIPRIMAWWKRRTFVKMWGSLRHRAKVSPKAAAVDAAETVEALVKDSAVGDTMACEQDLKLPEMSSGNLFHEYLEMAIQFGVLSLFSSAFPLGPLFAWINNIVELRLDAKKFVQNRRQLPRRSEGIGLWEKVLYFTQMLGVLTNASVIAFTADFIPKTVYRIANGGSLSGYIDAIYAKSTVDPLDPTASQGDINCEFRGFHDDTTGAKTSLYYEVLLARVAFVLAFQNAMFLIKILVAELIPETPRRVHVSLKQEEYQAEMAWEQQKARKRTTNPPRDQESMAEPADPEVTHRNRQGEGLLAWSQV
eukprot:m.409176 g.409176  ORF g.409176 m.409176 type:complete len:1152 (+) comp20153_c0_seq8:73-3528(+)